MSKKKCYACKKELDLEKFGKNKSKPDGLATECKICKSVADKEYRERNKDKLKLKHKKYYLENREKFIEKSKLQAKRDPIKHNKRGLKAKRKLKIGTISHYSNNESKCKNCPEDDIGVLTIDHINGNGAEHRREIGMEGRGGYDFYRWLKRNDYPEGFQVLCFSCQYKKRSMEMKPKNPTRTQIKTAEYVRSIKIECLENYGGLQCDCGENDIDVLTLDHSNNDGAKHRKETNTRGHNFYAMLRREGFPNDVPLQVKCMNCQIKKRNIKYEEDRKDRQTNYNKG